MPRPKKIDTTERKLFGVKVDVRIPPELKHLSVDLGVPTYKLAEKALWTFIKRQRAFLKNRQQKKSKP